ncbi:MAG: hypothetical protein ACI308_05650 [Muribaculaceae bacterium]
MKTFAFDSIERFSRFSEIRNIKKMICNKQWAAFAEDAESELYTFMPNGTVMITHQGTSLKGSWSYNAKTKTLSLRGKQNEHRFTVTYFDKAMMALRPEGDSQYSFLINKNNDVFFKPRFYPDIVQYFRQKEQEEDLQAAKAATNPGAAQPRQSEEFKDKVQQLQQEKMHMKQAEELSAQLSEGNSHKGAIAVIVIFVIVYIALFCHSIINEHRTIGDATINTLMFGTVLNVVIGLLCINKLVALVLTKIKVMMWKRANPNDPRNKYL